MRFLILTFPIILTGCSALETKINRAKGLGVMRLNPDQVHFEYKREGGNATFRETLCAGDFCGK